MDRAIISQRITSILGDIQRLTSALYAMNTADIQRYPDNYEVLSTDAAQRAEGIACRLRHLVYATTNVQKEEYLPAAVETMGISVREDNGIMEITVPCLLLKRKRRPGPEFLLDPLNNALSRYATTHPMPCYEHCVVCFTNVYDRELPERRVRDYDNLELKQLLDTAASYLMVDDSGLLCDVFHTTELGAEDCTRIFIMDSGRFPLWVKERKKVLGSIDS